MALEILGTKILGKYEILEQIGKDIFRARTATSESYREFEIQRIQQDTGGGNSPIRLRL